MNTILPFFVPQSAKTMFQPLKLLSFFSKNFVPDLPSRISCITIHPLYEHGVGNTCDCADADSTERIRHDKHESDPIWRTRQGSTSLNWASTTLASRGSRLWHGCPQLPRQSAPVRKDEAVVFILL